mmetsp:Transcript_84475/g.192562  ORF Transcript_84475/g.192562 Transcript_84475/m.192562 type:complete len:128 (-) Transcript_84475:564-947(-)
MKPQRAFVFVSAAITAATGVAAVIAGRQASNDLIMSAVEPTMASTVVFLGLATICAGVVGLCGGCSESRCGVLFFPFLYTFDRRCLHYWWGYRAESSQWGWWQYRRSMLDTTEDWRFAVSEGTHSAR